ncbi:MAG: cytochrome c oxidase subunit I [Gemmataceae bacterium]|nr:cytochrome c oxidase subunit I [Gemmataceae bacterium]
MSLHQETPHSPGFIRKYIFSEDHKTIGIQFLFSGMIFFGIGGLLAMLVRLQLAWPEGNIPWLGQWYPKSWGGRMSPDFYNMLFTMHATVMIFFVIIPWLTGAFGNFLIPLMIGARDMAFPKLNMLSYWAMIPAFVIIVASFFVEGGGASSGWTSYPTLADASLQKPASAAKPGEAYSVLKDDAYNSPAAPGAGMGQIFWLTSLLLVGLSSMMGSVNYITTILNMRAPGMSLLRMPLTVWSLFITAILQALALPVLTVALILQLLDKLIATTFFLPPGGISFGNWHTVPGGGMPLLWQHLFWFYSHPAVYIMILPAMGIVSDVITAFARKPLFGYKPMVYSLAAIAALGFVVWGHHMFQSGMDPRLGTGFMLATILIAVPSAIKTFNWLATLWESRIRYTAAMLNALAFVSMFVIGGLSGIFMAATPVDAYFHDTYFIVAHIHYVLFMSSIFGVFAGVLFWFPKMFGRTMHEGLAKVHFALTFLFGNLTFFPMHILGIGGHPRRYYDPTIYQYLEHLQPLNQFMTICALVLGAAQILFLVNFLGSLVFGKKAGINPWESNTLEWTVPSPPPHGNFPEPPTVERGPYEYAVEGPADFLPQAKEKPPEAGA